MIATTISCVTHRSSQCDLTVLHLYRCATTIALRTAPELTGPWSDPFDVFTPPESEVDDAFVYAGKAHPTLQGPGGGVLITYADNSFTFADLFDPAKASTLYWPHVAELIVHGLSR